MLIAHTIIGGLLFSDTLIEIVAIIVMGLIMVGLLGWLAAQIRHREAVSINHEPKGSAQA
jgi:hypothetical protein